MRVAGIQPGYLPWLGYFDQMLRVDAFLVADEMPFSSSGWVHRNRVKAPEGARWLTLPARPARGARIHEVPLAPGSPWARKHVATLRHLYARAPAARESIDALEKTLDPEERRLAAVSIATLRFLAARLGVATPILLSSELGLEARFRARFPGAEGPMHRIVAYLEALGADELLEGETGRSYFDEALFASFGLRVRFHRYRHPEYPQLHGAFVSHLSALDLLLNVGAEAAGRLLREGAARPPHD